MKHAWSHSFRVATAAVYGSSLLALGTACSPTSLVDVQASSTIVDPSQVKTEASALSFYNAALSFFPRPLISDGTVTTVVGMSAMSTDELAATNRSNYGGVDTRTISTPDNISYVSQLYTLLHLARIQAQQARQSLQLYAPNTPKTLQGRLFAIEGYTVLYFAELFCSGIPLTAVPVTGTPTPTPGLSTQELFARAAALFDSALVTGADSASVLNLARVGKGRALLGLGQFTEAAAAVHDVPTMYVYWQQMTTDLRNAMAYQIGNYRAEDAEGGTGMIWSADPRSAIVVLTGRAGSMLWPSKYFVTPSGTFDPLTIEEYTPVRVADGLEARLIEAEADLANHGSTWLATLSTLRATCLGNAACAPVPNLTAANLPDTLTDPGTDSARLDLLMHERALWLYLTGHREGDFRRLARIYQRDPHTLWPSGRVHAPAFPPLYSQPLQSNDTFYGNDVVFVPSPSEKQNNPLYTGCNNLSP